MSTPNDLPLDETEDAVDEPETFECDRCGKVMPLCDDCEYDPPSYSSPDGLGSLLCPRCAARRSNRRLSDD